MSDEGDSSGLDLSEGLRQEVKPYNIRTTVVSPGAVATELLNSITEPDVAETVRTCQGGPTMTTWSKDELCKIAEGDDLHISPFRDDGVTYGTPTWIWSVAVGDALYVSGYNGQESRWYHAAVQQKAGRIIDVNSFVIRWPAMETPGIAILDSLDNPARTGYKNDPNGHSARLETSVSGPSFGYRLMYDRSKGVNSGSATAGCIVFGTMAQGFVPTEGNTILTNINAQIA